MSDLDKILSKWVRLGANFNVEPSEEVLDIEALILETATFIPQFARLFSMTVTWLANHEDLVNRHRLAQKIRTTAKIEQSAILGYTLTTAQKVSGSKHYNLAIKECKPLLSPRPLFDVDKTNLKTLRFVEQFSEPEAKKWGLWATEERHYADALRPVSWIMDMNPSLRYRVFFGGRLPSTVISCLIEDPNYGQSG